MKVDMLNLSCFFDKDLLLERSKGQLLSYVVSSPQLINDVTANGVLIFVLARFRE